MKKVPVYLFKTLLLIYMSSGLYGQSATRKIDFDRPDPEFLESLLRDKFNEFRKNKGTHTLRADTVLHKAAKNQAKFNYRTNQLTNLQDKRKMATPFIRVNHFGGNHSLVEELEAMIVMGEKTRVKGQRGRVVLHSYEEAATAIFSEWENSRNYKDLLENPEYFRIGIGVVFVPDQNLIFATTVLSSEPYRKVKGVKYSSKSYKLLPYSREDCKYFAREFGYLSELFSSSLGLQGDSIIFHFHDLELLKSILKNSKDGFAVDIILRSQFDCDAGNRIHPATVEKGILMKPVWKSKLLHKNPLKEVKQFSAYLGKLPGELDPDDVELNLLILQNKCNCSSIIYNNIDSRNLRLLEMDFALDTISITEEIDSLSRRVSFTIPFEKNKADYLLEDIKPFLDSVQLNRFNIKQINITAYSSIEGDSAANELLQRKRAESILTAIQEYQLQSVQTNIITSENWDGFFASIKDSPYHDQFKTMSRLEIRQRLNSDTMSVNMEPYLASQRKADVNIIVESIYIDSLTPELLSTKFRRAVNDGEHIIAQGIQSLMLINVEDSVLDSDVLFPGEIPYVKENMPIMNNILAFRLKYFEKGDVDSLFENLKMELNRFLAVDPKNPHLNYNKLLTELYYWSGNIHYLQIDEANNVNQPRDLYKSIRKLYNTKIDNWKINQLMLNYHIIAADFYYEIQDYKMREKSLKEVKKFILKSNLNMEQTYTMAGYFMFQIHMDWAIEIMLPFLQEGNYDEDFLFRFISIAIYDEKQVPHETFIGYLEKAKEMDARRYCELFGAPNMSFQLLSDPKIKSSYCLTCNND